MSTKQDVLAKISPRYMLQYKIDLALQKIYQGDMDEQAESSDACPGSEFNVDQEAGYSSSGDDSDSHASLDNTDIRQTHSTSSSSSVTSSSSSVTSSSSSDGEPSAAPQAEKRSFSREDDFNEEESQPETQALSDVIDDVTTTAPPVPKPRKRKASKELQRVDDDPDQEHSAVDDLQSRSTESPSEKIDDMTSHEVASLPAESDFADQTAAPEGAEFEEHATSEGGEEVKEGEQTEDDGGAQILEAPGELVHPVASDSCKQDAAIGAFQTGEEGRSVASESDGRSRNDSVSEGSESDASSMDELDVANTQYVYEVTPVDDERSSSSSSDSDVTPDDASAETNKEEISNESSVVTVSVLTVEDSPGDTKEQIQVPDVSHTYSDKAAGFVERRDSSSSSSESSAGEVEPGQVSMDADTTPARDSIVSDADHAERFAPALARAVVIDGVYEAAGVELATAATSNEDAAPEFRPRVTEPGDDQATGDEEMQYVGDEVADEPQNSIETAAEGQEAVDSEAPLKESAASSSSASSSRKESVRSSSSSSSSSDEQESYYPHQPVGEDIHVEEDRREDPGAKERILEEESRNPESEEYVEVFQEAKKEEEDTEVEMRIIEHTGLINRDEDPEDKSKSTYNAAHSQRNTDATKWFGEPKPKDKVWLKPKGKVDDDAEAERRKVIKAMTRKHNPNMVQKWKPPVEKDWKDGLDGHKKESLRKYEERRKQRIESETESTARLRAASTESFADSQTSEHSSASNLDQQQQLQHSTHQPDQVESKVVGNSEIVFESVVHSRDAISVWESRLSQKFEKEKTEEKRLSLGKQRRTLWEAKRRERTESTSSVTSSTSSMSEIPQSENIIRESIGVSDVRNRWKDMDHGNAHKTPPAVSPKPSSSSRRTQSFTVQSSSPYRSFGRVSSAKSTPTQAVNSDVTVVTRRPGESLIDYEIREAAEREEKWKKENLKSESQEPSTPRSPEPAAMHTMTIDPHAAHPHPPHHDEIPTPTKNENRKHEETKTPVVEPPVTPVKARSQTMPALDLSFALEESRANDVTDKHVPADVDTGADSGIECNVTNAVTRSDVASPLSEDGRFPSGSAAPPSGHDDDYASSELSATSQDDSHASKENSPSSKSPQSSTLPVVMSPKGWTPKNAPTSPVSPVTPEKSFAVTNGHPSSPPPPPAPASADENGIKEEDVNDVAEEEEKKDVVPELNTTQHDSVDPSLAGANKTTMVVTRQRSGPSFEVVSSKNRLQTIMELEIKEAAKREEEWKKRRENCSPEDGAKAASPTPTSQAPKESPKEQPKVAPVVYRKPVKVLPNGDTNEKKVKEEKMNDANDKTTQKIVNASSAEYKKNSVVKANRVHRRKSNLAMQWEAGKYKNHEEE